MRLPAIVEGDRATGTFAAGNDAGAIGIVELIGVCAVELERFFLARGIVVGSLLHHGKMLHMWVRAFRERSHGENFGVRNDTLGDNV
jgi:hypothetical protein